MSDLLIGMALVLVILALSFAIILLLANLGYYFTKISQGTTVFINAGDSMRNVLPNITGFQLSEKEDPDGQQWLVPTKNDKERIDSLFRDSVWGTKWFQRWLWEQFGIRFISWFWPHVHVHRFDIRSRKRVKERSEIVPNAPLRSRVVDSPGATGPEGSTEVDSLLFLVPRPVYVEGLELAGDNSKINLLVLPVFRQVIPSLSVYNLKGDFFTLLDAAIEAALVDFFARHRVAVDGEGKFVKDALDGEEGSPLTYAHWLKLTKAGEGTPLERLLRRINVSKKYLSTLDPDLVAYVRNHNLCAPGEADDLSASPELEKAIPSGIIPRFGFALVSFRIVEWEAHESTEPLAKALLARETESHTAEGVRKKAEGERDADKARAEGYASRYRLPVQALVDMKVDPNVAANVLATQLRTENIRAAGLSTYVEGGSSASVMVPASSSKP